MSVFRNSKKDTKINFTLMNNNDIMKKVKLLQKVEPSKDWISGNRDILLKKIQNQEEISPSFITQFQEAWALFFPQKLATALARPMVAVILIGAFILSGGILTVGAARGSLPGDFLYSVKTTTEKIQMGLTSGETGKVKLQAEFVGRRVDELSQLAEKPEVERGKVEAAVKNFQKELKTVKTRVENAEQKVETAKLVKEKTKEYLTVLDKTEEKISPDIETAQLVRAALTSAQTTAKEVAKIINEAELAEEQIGEQLSSEEKAVTEKQAATTDQQEKAVEEESVKGGIIREPL